MRNTVGFKREGGGIIGGWRKTHNEEAHEVYFLPNMIGVMTFGCMSWVGHVTRMEEKINARRVLMGSPKENKTQVYMRG